MYTITYLAEDGCGALRVLAISTPNEWTAVDVAISLRAGTQPVSTGRGW